MFEISLITVGIGLVLTALVHRFVTRNYFYFADKPIPFLRPTFGVGNFGPLLMRKRDILEHLKALYRSFPDAKIFGFFNMTEPIFMVRDPEMVKQITVKDFDHFVDHTLNAAGGTDQDTTGSQSLFTDSLVVLRGNKWRDMRATLSPAFTGSKMRQMFALITDCGQSVVEYYRESAAGAQSGRVVVELKDVFSRFANDVIASAAFGISVDSFRERDNEFYLLGQSMTQQMGVVQALKLAGFMLFPKLMVRFGVDFLSADQDKFFRGLITETMRTREAKSIFRPDMIELLMQAKKGNLKRQSAEDQTKPEVEGFAVVEESQVGKRSHNRTWTENELIAQAFIFFFAGFESISITLCFIAYELTRDATVQERLYREIRDTNRALDGRSLSYEVLQGMKYLDMVVSEAMRIWPIGQVVERLCVKDYIYDDHQGCRFTIEKGRSVFASIVGFHHDPKYFPEPEEFDPERFSEANKHNINLGAYLPFGIGPRNCIGSRFALMEVKAVMYYLLLNFSFDVHQKTQIPLRLKKSLMRVMPEKGFWIELTPRPDINKANLGK
ncbi:probable cytochrome P450 9f2 [Toxorhynchites rutilus septentrionalis]|uniref:probable cytochrome P450 9f2 n=1 Tax=Toxorhynchites rutilus septentrionalis TaxID=329112 RepID=UPI00247A7A58|nr:probable cytochrome P450 9f2 [Toxorhynchites rutilus septentrionalis]